MRSGGNFFLTALLSLLVFATLTVSAGGRWALSAFQTGVFTLAGVWAVRAAARAERLIWHKVLFLLGFPVVWILMQLLAGTTVYRWETWNALLTWGASWVALFLATQTLADSDLRARFLRAVLWFGFVLSVISTLQLFTSHGKIFWIFPSGYDDLVLGPFVYRNQYAAFIELLLPIAVVAAFSERRPTLPGLMCGVMYASVIASTSRAGSALATLEIAVVGLVCALRRRPVVRRSGLVLASIAVPVLAFTTLVGLEPLLQRFHLADPFVYRRELLQASIAMVRDRPWLGFGLGTWPNVYPSFATIDAGRFMNHAHNDWAELAAEGGIPLFIALLIVALWTVPAALRRSPWALGVPVVFLHAAVDYPLQKPALVAWLFVFIGMLAGGRKAARAKDVEVTELQVAACSPKAAAIWSGRIDSP